MKTKPEKLNKRNNKKMKLHRRKPVEFHFIKVSLSSKIPKPLQKEPHFHTMVT